MCTKKVKKHWFLRYPLVPAFILPVFGIIGVALLAQLLLAGMLTVFGEEIRAFRALPDVVQGLVRIFLAVFMIFVMKITNGAQFVFGFCKERMGQSIFLSSFSILVAVSNLIEYSTAGLPFHTGFMGISIALLSGIAPGIFEEVVCRGIVVNNMMHRWRQKEQYILRTVLASGLAFGLVHLMNLKNGDVLGTLLQVCYAAALGIFFGSVYVRTHNIWGPVILHSIIDFSAFIFIGEAQTTAYAIASSIAVTVIYTAAGLYLIRKQKQEEIRILWEDAMQTNGKQHENYKKANIKGGTVL